MPGLIEALGDIQYKNEAHRILVEGVYLDPFRVCPISSCWRLNSYWLGQNLSDKLSKYTDMVETTLDLASLETHTYTIKPEYDDGLQALATKLMEVANSYTLYI